MIKAQKQSDWKENQHTNHNFLRDKGELPSVDACV